MAITLQTVQNIIKDAKGTALGSITVNIDLVLLDVDGAVSSLPQGFVNDAAVSTDWTINAGTTVTTNASGVWTTGATMVPNSLISGVTNSCYRIVENTPTPRTYYIQVPTSGTPHWVGSILYSTPGVAGSFVAPALSFRAVSTNSATLLASDSVLLITTSGTATLAMPLASSVTVGKIFYVRTLGTNGVTLSFTSPDTVSNTAPANMTIGVTASRIYTSDGSKWIQLA